MHVIENNLQHALNVLENGMIIIIDQTKVMLIKSAKEKYILKE